MKALNMMTRRIIRISSELFNLLIVMTFLVLLAFGCYSNWEADQIYDLADEKTYAAYKPGDDESLNFAELVEINPDTCAWLSVYGTKIDYPVFQAADNDKYINMDARGDYSMAGALFLDYRNNKESFDFNSIIYGHHMEKEKMFGGLDKFKGQEYFAEYEYGDIFLQDRHYGIRIYALLLEDAYNTQTYNPAIEQNEKKEAYINYIKSHAKQYREVGVDQNSRILLLSTCASDTTNGRIILVAQITDEVYENPFGEDEAKIMEKTEQLEWAWVIVLVLLIVTAAFTLWRSSRKMR